MSADAVTRAQAKLDEIATRVMHLQDRERECRATIDRFHEWQATAGSLYFEECAILAEFEGIIPHLFTLYYEVAGRRHLQHGESVTTKATELGRQLKIVAAELDLFARGGQIEGRALDLG